MQYQEGQEMAHAAVGPFVPVPVPAEFVVDVMGFIASMAHAGVDSDSNTRGDEVGTTTPSPTGSSEPEGAGGGGSGELPHIEWSVDDLERLAASKVWTPSAVSRMLDLLAENPGEWSTTTEMVEGLSSLNMSRNDLRGTLAALTRHTKKHYRRRNWPMEVGWGPDISAGYPEEMHYRVDDELAARWREARARTPGG